MNTLDNGKKDDFNSISNEVKADTDQSKSFNLCHKGEQYCCSPSSLYHDHNGFSSEKQYILINKGGDVIMENKKYSLSKIQLMGMATEVLYGIFSEKITEKGFAILDRLLRAFLDENENISDALTELDSFIVHLYLILDPLMNGEVEEQQ